MTKEPEGQSLDLVHERYSGQFLSQILSPKNERNDTL